jgi:hypothetical protein
MGPRAALLALAAVAAAARADVTPPVPARAANPPAAKPAPDDDTCSARQWLALKRAVRAYCTRGAGRDSWDCEQIRRDLEVPFCDGERDPPGCAHAFLVREGLGRCRVRAAGDALTFAVYPDCWDWSIEAVPTRRGYRVRSASWSGGNCD